MHGYGAQRRRTIGAPHIIFSFTFDNRGAHEQRKKNPPDRIPHHNPPRIDSGMKNRT